jgi:Predicted membrane protein (DUF2306)
VSQVGNTMLALLWLPVTITGFWMARHKRFVEHREWMIRSYALTTSIVVNRLWGAVLVLVLLPQLDSTFGGNQDALIDTVANTSVWLSWTVNLLVAEWWLQRGRSARLSRQAAAQPA